MILCLSVIYIEQLQLSLIESSYNDDDNYYPHDDMIC